jgi:hypothetical protein
MEHCRWQEDNGCYCHAVVHIIRSGQGINLLSYSWSCGACTGIIVEYGGKLASLDFLVHNGEMSASCDYTVHLICPYLSLFTCIIVFPPTQVRALGLIGYVLTSSFLIRENILAVITINIHASLSYVFTAMGLNIMPSMSLIYMIFGTVLLLNSGFFVLLLHLLYSIFLTRLGMKSSLRLPAWLDKAI